MSKKYLITLNDHEQEILSDIVSNLNDALKERGLPVKCTETGYVTNLVKIELSNQEITKNLEGDYITYDIRE